MACNDLIDNHSLEDVYNDDNVVASNTVATLCRDDNTKVAQVLLYDTANTDMLIRPIERTFFRSKELLSAKGTQGKVVKHEYFVLKDEFRGKKVVSVIHPKEMDLYRACQFQEIQLDAAWDGLVVWKKMFFKFASPQAESFMKIAIQRYLRDVKSMSVDDIAKSIKNNPFSISPSLLKDPRNPANDFSSWVSRMFGRQVVISMYKEVA